MDAMNMHEGELAKAWRQRHGFTMQRLSELTGYSPEAIHLFERNRNSVGKPHAAVAWRRYRLACLAVQCIAQLGRLDEMAQGEWTWQ